MNWGYRPADPVWLSRLQRLHADFRLSWGEKLLYGAMFVITAVMVVLCGKAMMVMGAAASLWPFEMVYALVLVGLIALGYVAVARFAVRYEFRGGRLRVFNSWGQLKLNEDLQHLREVSCFRGRWTTSLRLRWPDRARTIMLIHSLEAALEQAH